MRCCEGQAQTDNETESLGVLEMDEVRRGPGAESGRQASRSLLPRFQPGRSREGSLVKQAEHAGERARTEPLERPGQGSCPYAGTPLSRGRPGPRGRAGFLGVLRGRRLPRGARGSAQPRSLCVSEDSSMKARFSLG